MAKLRWSAADIAQVVSGTLHGKTDWEISGIVMDSRAVRAGDLFLALPGATVDGHNFLKAAAEKGATAALVSRLPDEPIDLPLVLVPSTAEMPDLPDRSDVLVALWKLAEAARKRAKAKIVAITGSVGKTSAKEALSLALSAYGSVHATAGNYNNHIGLPLTLALLPADADFAVLEMGMNHAGEIEPLSRLARPDVALITTVDAVHIEYFDGIEGIACAKAEVFAGLGNTGIAVLPADNAQLDVLRTEAARYGVQKLRYFGKVECAEYAAMNPQITANGTAFGLKHQGTETPIALKAIGAHWAVVMAGVMACVDALGLPWAKAVAALADFREPVGRGRMQEVVVAGKRVHVLDDSYNASPVSMRGAIEKLGLIAANTGRRPVAVLGQMLELGTTTEAAHRGLADALAQANIEIVGACGGFMQSMIDARVEAGHGQETIFAPDAASLRPLMEDVLRDGDVVLIKGSHGSKVYQIAEAWLHQ
jgi:UDP-N-acetylmuramoyl-tripeptide--D-alanyl-D-alanine ligase